MRERLDALVSEFIEQAGKEDFEYKFDSFKVETTSRKVLSELIGQFMKRAKDLDAKMANVEPFLIQSKIRLDTVEK